MGILFLITELILLVSFIIVKKTAKKLNIMTFIVMSIGILLCYNVLICYILTFFTIPITLPILSIINIVVAGLITCIIIKNKRIQEFEFKKIDLLHISILGVCVLIVAYINFGFPFNIKYETGDPSVHYLTSEMFADSDALLIKEPDEVYGSFDTRKTASYVNSGLLMKCFKNVMDSFDYYKIFIVFGIFIFFITSWAMYSLLIKFSKDNKTKFLAFSVTLLYTMGYPLNSFLFGFEYLSMGILMVELIFLMIEYFKDDNMNYAMKVSMLALLNFGLFHSYWMFVPFMYPAEWIYLCIESYKEKKTIFNKKNILTLTITLLVPFLLGFIYYMVPQAYAIRVKQKIDTDTFLDLSKYLVNKGLSVDGYIYINLFSNMLLLLPIPAYLCVKKIRENKFEAICLAICILFIEILLIGNALERVSLYYISKNYYILWFILMFLNYKGLALLYEKRKSLSFALIGVYTLLVLIELTSGTGIMKNEEYYLKDESPLGVVNIYGANQDILVNHVTDLYAEELETLKYMSHIDKGARIEFLGNWEQCYWQYTLTRYFNNKDKKITTWGQTAIEDKLIATKEDIYSADYIVCIKRSNPYNYLKNEIDNIGETVFENDYGRVVKCNK